MRENALMVCDREVRPRGPVQAAPGITGDAPPLPTLTDTAFRIGVERATAYQCVLPGMVPGAVRIRKRWWVALFRERREALSPTGSWPIHSGERQRIESC
jgi:hypothetical protein